MLGFGVNKLLNKNHTERRNQSLVASRSHDSMEQIDNLQNLNDFDPEADVRCVTAAHTDRFSQLSVRKTLTKSR